MNGLLLDTMVFIWARENAKALPRGMRAAIASADMVYVSIASGWEMAIKTALGKLRLTETFVQGMARGGYDLLSIDYAHLERVASLPHHHRDPFDRMLIAQAQAEGLTIATADPEFHRYGVPLVKV